ncbi:hypothetical protein BTR23_12495 [Alkalihalophilus pseudofirmus]|nr:hypothetical protein BTR23_12495 [Alkalihalophilus pseudofirmus]
MAVVPAVNLPLRALKNGDLIILYDDLKTNMANLIGLAEHVSPEKVNFMTKIGQGLTYVCITEEKAEQLLLSKMIERDQLEETKSFTISIDFKDTTTGISSIERSDTISAMTRMEYQPSDFKRPGHVFPLIGKRNGLLDRIGVTEALIDLTKMITSTHVGYMTEILNSTGEIASYEEIEQISSAYDIPILSISELIIMKQDEFIQLLEGTVVDGRKIGRKIGFPTANIELIGNNIALPRGVYGVKVFHQNREYLGVMNVGKRPTFTRNSNELHYEVHILNFNEMIYGQALDVKVCFYLREEIAFPSFNDLIAQINRDIDSVVNRFHLIKTD